MDSFVPAGFLAGPHLQTLTVAMPRGVPPRTYLRAGKPFTHPLHDTAGSSLTGVVHWSAARSAPLVILVHGLGGSVDSLYVQQAGYALWQRGYHVLALNQRGAGNSANVAPYLYHAGLTDDLDAVTRAFTTAPGVDGVSLVGFSIGGNVVLNLAARWADAAPARVKAVVSLAAPVDLAAASRNLERWQSAFYRHHVLRGLIAGAARFRLAHPARARFSLRRLLPLTSLRSYDELVVVPEYGFDDADDYYAKASAGPHLGAIQVPTLLLHAKDDPMVPGAGIEAALQRASSAIDVHVTARGGHLGWAEGLGQGELAQRWSTRMLLSFLEAKA